MTELTLDENHVYRRGLDTPPGVTTILKRVGFISDRWFTEQAATRGDYVHKACQFLEEGTLDDSTVDEELRGYLKAYQRFLDETGWISYKIEKPLYHDVLGYAGTPDRVGTMPPRRRSNDIISNPGILDIKSGIPFDWHKYQLAAYTMLEAPVLYHELSRYSVYLRPDGTYILARYSDKNDAKVFLAALTIFNALPKEAK